MKRLLLSLATAMALVGCRSSQPATNPFLRTTVPPPATGAPAVVVPGEQFSPGVAAPVVTPAAPAVVTPPAVVAPPPAVVAPPVVAPPRDKYSPPGGSFQYNQSLLQQRPGTTQASGVVTASYREAAAPASAAPAVQKGEPALPAPIVGLGTPGNQIRVVPPTSTEVVRAQSQDHLRDEAEPAHADNANDRQISDDSESEEDSFADAEPVRSIDPAAFGYAPDYAWLKGRLEYSEASRQWKLRYIPIDGPTDQFGGSVKLPGGAAMNALKPGDLVSVRGALAVSASAKDNLAPLYNVVQIEPRR